MSKFSTTIPVDIASIIAKLPQDNFIHSVSLNADNSGVEIVWESSKFVTPVTFPTEFPVKDIEKKVLPKGVKIATVVTRSPAKTLTIKKSVDTKTKK
jgi:hypothetical protein